MQDTNAIAQKILQDTLQAFPYGATNVKASYYVKRLERYECYSGLFQQKPRARAVDALLLEDLSDAKWTQLMKNRQSIDKLIRNSDGLPMFRRRQMVRLKLATLSANSGIGNCEEMSTYAFCQMLARYPSVNAEFIVFCKPNDHAFIMIGRPPSTDINDWANFGDEVMIIDPWIGEAFPANQLSQFWKTNALNICPSQITLHAKFASHEFFPACKPFRP